MFREIVCIICIHLFANNFIRWKMQTIFVCERFAKYSVYSRECPNMRIFICKSARVIDKDTKMLYMTWFFWQSWKRFMFFPLFKEGVFIFHGSSWLVSVKLSRTLLFTHNVLPRSFLKIELKWFFFLRIGHLDFRYVHHIGRGSKSLVMN